MKKTFLIALMAGIFVLGCGKPLYVGTIGAKVYHVPDCKYAQQSHAKYGKIKRIEYHSRFHKDLSGRKPCPKCIK